MTAASWFNRIFGIVFGALLASYALTEVLIDPFGVFGFTHFNRQNFWPNIRFGQIEFDVRTGQFVSWSEM